MLRLILTFIAKSENFTKKIAEDNKFMVIHTLLDILLGPGLPMTEFSFKIKYLVITVLRQALKHSLKTK